MKNKNTLTITHLGFVERLRVETIRGER